MKKKKTTILAIGDKVDFDSFQKFNKESKYMRKNGFEYRAIDYKAFFKKKHMDILSDRVIVFSFFPFKYWDKNIECRNYKGMYGNLGFLKKFRKFSSDCVLRINKLLPDKKVEFVNDLYKTSVYRDKMAVMDNLSKSGVKVPEGMRTKSIKVIKEALSAGRKFYIKPRCGSMGKGITYLTNDKWQTNFSVKGNALCKRYSDYGWKFMDITGNTNILQSIIKGDVLIEEAVSLLNIGKSKIDFRVYAFRNKVLYIYPRKNDMGAVTTNISQGGKGAPAVLKKIPSRVIRKIEQNVNKTMAVLGLGFAGIDVIVDSNLKDVYVIDVNMFPGFPKRKTYNLSRSIISELKRTN